MVAQCGIDVVSGGECPSLPCEQEAVVAKMVVGIPNAYIEGYAAIEFFEIILCVCAVANNEIDDIQIPFASLHPVAVSETEKVHR